MSFVAARDGDDAVVFANDKGYLRAVLKGDRYQITVNGDNPLDDYPIGNFTRDELFHRTFDCTYPDAVIQMFLLFSSPRSGDIVLSSEPGFDLRLQYEDPEHHGSHGSLHRDHMQVPLALSVPFQNEHVHNFDLVPTILALTGKQASKHMDGRLLELEDGHRQNKVNPEIGPAKSQSVVGNNDKNSTFNSALVTIGIILTGIILVGMFREQINEFGILLMTRYGQEWVDGVLFLVTAVSSTPLALPIWGYTLAGVALGYHVIRLAAVMAVGSALGSFVTFGVGRYFAERQWVKKRFPNVFNNPWTYGRSKKYVTWILFLGTASPIPCDVLYVACGAKRYPPLLFLLMMIAGRFVRYIYLGYGFKYFSDWL